MFLKYIRSDLMWKMCRFSVCSCTLCSLISFENMKNTEIVPKLFKCMTRKFYAKYMSIFWKESAIFIVEKPFAVPISSTFFGNSWDRFLRKKYAVFHEILGISLWVDMLFIASRNRTNFSSNHINMSSRAVMTSRDKFVL